MDELRRQSKHLCKQEDLEEVRKQELQKAVTGVEDQWRDLLQTAEEVLNKAQDEAGVYKQFEDFKSQINDVQTWIKEQKRKLMSTGSHIQFEERMQIVKVRVSVRSGLILLRLASCSCLEFGEIVRMNSSGLSSPSGCSELQT